MSSNRVSELWAKQPTTLRILAQALKNPVIHEKSAVALGASIVRYIQGRRAAKLMIPVLSSPSAIARRWAIEAVLWVEDETIWNSLFSLAGDTSSLVRRTLYMGIHTWLNRGHTFTASHHKQAESILRLALIDKDPEVRTVAENTISELSSLHGKKRISSTL